MAAKHSGSLIQSSFGVNGNFELVVASRRGGLAHFWRDNDAAGLPWNGPQLFGCASASAPSLVQNSQGSLELFACSGGRVAAYTRSARWSVPTYLGNNLGCNPAAIQTDDGKLHMIIPLAGGAFAYWTRPADLQAPWQALPVFGPPAIPVYSVAMLESNFGDPGNLEIVAIMGAQPALFLAHFWKDSSGNWFGPNVIPLDGLPPGVSPSGVPAFLQSTHGTKGNFELVVPLSTGGLAHFTRDNDADGFPWQPAKTFGSGMFSSVSLLQSSFGSAGLGNLELIGCVEGRIEHYWCDDQTLQWSGPTSVIYDEPAVVPSTTGEWRIEHACEPVGIHAALLSTNRILFFSYAEHDQSHGVSSVFDTSDDSIEHVHQDEDLFCAGHAFLPDGRLLVVGGHVTGEKSMFLFTPSGDGGSWNQLPDLPEGRWYPTCTTLPDGTVFIISGSKKSGGGPVNDTWQIFHPTLGLQPPQPAPFLNETAPYNTYPFVYVLPSGKLFIFSADRACLFDLSTKTFSDTRMFCKRDIPRTYPLEGSSVLLPLLPGSNPPYRARVLVIGGGGLPEGQSTPATNSCEILDLDDPAPEWKFAASMVVGRVMPDAVLLPDGKVLVMNGSSAGKADNAVNPVFQTELYDPVSNTWSAAGETRIPRLYHATALLLPDGTVMTAGMDEEFNPDPFHYPEYRLEIYYPPYLFAGPRPELQSAPGDIGYAASFQIQCDDAHSIASASMLRAGSVTHSFNMDQRYVGLSITGRDANTITLASPPDANIAPPGYYLLFVLNNAGVPSVGRFVSLT